MPLLRRMPPAPYETLTGLLERHRVANYYDEPSWLAPWLIKEWGQNLDLLRHRQNYELIAELLQIDPDTIYQHTLHRFVPTFYGDTNPHHYARTRTPTDVDRPLWEMKRLATYVHGHAMPKVCPLC